jgi:heterodisulfide reductase subunit B
MKLTRSCREISALISTEADRNLTVRERAAMHVHITICRRCTAWKQQVHVLNKSMKAWRNYSE